MNATQETTTECECDISTSPVPTTDVETDVEVLSAVANPTRYEALRIVAEELDGRCVCEVESALAVSQGAVSQALSRLRSAGLLTRRKEGRWRYYSATDRARRLIQTLDDVRDADE